MRKFFFLISFFLGFASCSLGTKNHKTHIGVPEVIIKTTLGNITIELFPKQAPLTVENFLSYVKKGHYNHTIFHRVIDGFMIQGGGLTADLASKPTGAPIQNEADNGLKNLRGALAMARTSEINSATSQFFINVKDNDFLNFQDKTPSRYGYCVFGKVTDGMDIVDKIKSVPTTTRKGYSDVPVTPIEILEIIYKEEKSNS